MKRCSWVLPLVLLLAYAVTGHNTVVIRRHVSRSSLAAQSFNREV